MSGKNLKIVCVDTFRETLAKFNENMTKAGVIDYISTMVVTSEIASYNVGNAAVFAIFIDGGEIKDIKNWYPKIKPGGIIAGYNLSTPDSIKKAFESLGAKDFKEEDGIWFARKPHLARLN